MEKTCLINPATGRAIKIDGRLGKRVLKKQEKEFAKQQPPSMTNTRKAAKNPEPKPKRTYITKKKKEEASINILNIKNQWGKILQRKSL